MALLRFTSLRLLRGLLTLWFAVSVTFFLVRLLPGDPALAIASPTMGEEQRQQILADFGLDRPLAVQYVTYLGELLQGNLGVSFRQSVPVADVLLERLPWTLILTGSALVVTLLLGLPLGVLAATHRGGALDRAIQIGGVVGQSLFVPTVGIALLYTFGLWLGWFPIGGAIDDDVYGLEAYASMLRHLVLPCLSLVVLQIGAYVLTLRTNLIDALGEDYIRTARAKGLPERKVVMRHGLRASLTPVVTMFGMDLALLLGGAIITEKVFDIKGIGAWAVDSVFRSDIPVVVAVTLLAALAVTMMNLVVDVIYAYLDPRVRLE
jgi:peptide/nickel transport system permease protein